MLSDVLLQNRYIKHTTKLIELTELEIERTKYQHDFQQLAIMYREKFKNELEVFYKYNNNIVTAFKELQDAGYLEIITCSATHGFLPLLSMHPEAVRAQISIGIETYVKHFGQKPRGIWLPECGYVPETEEYLVENGIEYILIESHGILFAEPRPIYGTFSPIVSQNGIVAFGRDIESSMQVWSADVGYPGANEYRDFYRDIGYDLDINYISPYISSDGSRIHTGVKYHKITGKTEQKELYAPEEAKAKVLEHTADFLSKRIEQVDFLSSRMDKPPIIMCPYDAELFGHWWYEGPYWLYAVLKELGSESSEIASITPGTYIDNYPLMQVASPCRSSWGANGYNEVWLNEKNDWIYRHLHLAAERMIEIANDHPNSSGLQNAALNQAARELLLAQSSDWAFIMKAGTVVQYAEKRTKDHISRFTKLYYDIKENTIDQKWLSDIQWKDNIFPDIDYKIYKSM
jgi:1,4-alpha-glucan branching enzyme